MSKTNESTKIRKALADVEQQQAEARARLSEAEAALSEAVAAEALGEASRAGEQRAAVEAEQRRLRELAIVAEGLRVKLQRAELAEAAHKKAGQESLLDTLNRVTVEHAEMLEHALAELARTVEAYRGAVAQRDSVARGLGLRLQDCEIRLSGALGAFCASLQLQPAPLSLARAYSAGLAVAEAAVAGRTGAEEDARKAKAAAEQAEQAAREERDVARWKSEAERTREALARVEAEARRLGLKSKRAEELRAALRTVEAKLKRAEQLTAEAAA